MQLGPMDWSEVEFLLDSGSVQLLDEVRTESLDEWQTLQDVLAGQDRKASVIASSGEPASFDVSLRSQMSAVVETAQSRFVDEETSPAEDVAVRDQSPLVAEREELSLLEPHWFVRTMRGETGPLPVSAIDELIREGRIGPDDLLRKETEPDWKPPTSFGFVFPVPEPPEAVEPSSEVVEAAARRARSYQAPWSRRLLWTVCAPWFYAVSLLSGLGRLRRGLQVAVIVLLMAGIAAGYRVADEWSHRVLPGTITLDGEPLGDVLIQLTGPETGETAIGVSGSEGHFVLVSASGRLSPGQYIVTVKDISSDGRQQSLSRRVPVAFESLLTSGLTCTIEPQMESCPLTLVRVR